MSEETQNSQNGLGAIIERRFNRRGLLGGLFKSIPAVTLMGAQASALEVSGLSAEAAIDAAKDSRITFTPISLSREDAINVPSGYKVGVLVSCLR